MDLPLDLLFFRNKYKKEWMKLPSIRVRDGSGYRPLMTLYPAALRGVWADSPVQRPQQNQLCREINVEIKCLMKGITAANAQTKLLVNPHVPLGVKRVNKYILFASKSCIRMH